MSKTFLIFLVCLLGFVSGALSAAEAVLELNPTFENCSIQVRNAPDSKDIWIQFREKGKQEWKQGLPLVRLPRPGSVRDWMNPEKILRLPYSDGEWRGSLFHLKENTPYEIRVRLIPSEKILTGTFHTGNSAPPPIGQTIYLEDRSSFNFSLQGKPDAWIKITMRNPEKPLTDEQKPRLSVIGLNHSSYVLLEKINLQGGDRFCLLVENSNHIRIINSEFSGNSRTFGQNLDTTGQYIRRDGRHPYNEGAITFQNSGNILLERNFIHTPSGTANSWFYSHPFGPMAVSTGNMTGNTVFRYNDFVGSMFHRYDDVIGGGDNASPTGGFAKDADIYGNFFINANDDAIELDGGQSNLRFYGNRMCATYCGISCAPCIVGPSYVFGNLFHDPGDRELNYSHMLKNHFGDIGTGRIHYIGNTGKGIGGNPVLRYSDRTTRIVTRNNVFPETTPAVGVPNDMDFDLYFESDLRLEAHLKKLHQGSFPQKNGCRANPVFENPESGNYHLKPGSPGTGKSVFIPNLWEFSGKDPGAFPLEKSENLPLRPFGVNVNFNRIGFSAPDDLKEKSIRMTAERSGFYRIRKSPAMDYISIDPVEGTIKKGESILFRVRLLSEKLKKARRYNDAFLIRFSDGWSIPVNVHTDLRKSSRHLVTEGHVIETPADKMLHADTYQKTANGLLRFHPGENRKELVWTFEVPKTGRYYLFGNFQTSGIELNLLEYSLDGEPFGKMNASGGGPFWNQQIRKLWRTTKIPNKRFESFLLSKGKHTIRFRPLRPIDLNSFLLTDDIDRIYR